MRKYLPLLALIVFIGFASAFFFFGCGQSSLEVETTTTVPTTTTLYSSYYPLVPGRMITYEVIQVSGTTEASTRESWRIGSAEAMVSTGGMVVGTTEATAGTIEVYPIYISSGWSRSRLYALEDITGAYFHGSGTMPAAAKTDVLLSYPLSVGATWESPARLITKVITKESVTTAVGTFECKQVFYSTGTPVVIYRWFALNVGMIKEHSGDATSWISREVISKNY